MRFVWAETFSSSISARTSVSEGSDLTLFDPGRPVPDGPVAGLSVLSVADLFCFMPSNLPQLHWRDATHRVELPCEYHTGARPGNHALAPSILALTFTNSAGVFTLTS